MVKQLDFLNTERKAKTFLKRLAPEDTQFTFQTFDDGVKNDKKLVHVLHGTLDKHLQKLIQKLQLYGVEHIPLLRRSLA